jgi:valyl-tRNA synthetase
MLDLSLRLLHPFIPFITEELWGHLRLALLGSPLADLVKDWPEALIVAPWPEPRPEEGWERGKVEDFTLLQETVRAIRNVRAEKKVSPAKRIPAVVAAGTKIELFKDQAAVMAVLAGLDPSQFSIHPSLDLKPGDAVALVVGQVEIYIPLSGMLDMDAERARLEQELGSVQAQVDRLEKLLDSDFAGKAPPPIVQKERERLASLLETAGKLNAQLG